MENNDAQQTALLNTTLSESAVSSNLIVDHDAKVMPAFAVSDNREVYEEDEEEDIKPPFPQNNVRELKRLPPDMFAKRPATKEKYAGFKLGWLAKLAAIAVVFFFAAFLGIMAAGFMRENSEMVIKEREYQRQVLAERQQKIDEQTAELEREKKRLELEEEMLAARKRSIEQEENRLIGKHEQLYAEESANAESFVSSLLDKVTGRDTERREAMARTAREKEAASKNGDEVDRALRDAQATLDDVNEKLAAARAMKKDIDGVRQQIEAAYIENKDTVDSVIYYTRAGVAAMGELLGNRANDNS